MSVFYPGGAETFRVAGSISQGYSLAEAQRVLRAIAKVESETQQPWGGPFRQVVLAENELNSYIAYRIETEKEEIMKELKLKLFPENRLEGKIHLDLRAQEIPRFIKPEMDIYFSAGLEIANGMVRIHMTRLFLENQPIQPAILDLVIAISAKLNNEKATSINDWYPLPYGIKNIKTDNGRATFFY